MQRLDLYIVIVDGLIKVHSLLGITIHVGIAVILTVYILLEGLLHLGELDSHRTGNTHALHQAGSIHLSFKQMAVMTVELVSLKKFQTSVMVL